MNEAKFKEQMNLLAQAKKELTKRLGELELIASEEKLISQIAVMPKLPKKLFTRGQMLKIIEEVMIAGHLIYNSSKKQVDK